MDSDEEWSRDGFIKKSIFSAKNKCQFCAAFSIDEASSAVHSENCVARLSAFLASDGQIKFACMVCRDVFDGQNELSEHEELHKYPGGFGCIMCNDTFMNERDRIRHTEDVHKTFECLRCESVSQIYDEVQYIEHCERDHSGLSGYALCLECGAGFEEKSHLRFHSETECGHFRTWTCSQCAAIFQTQNALNEHIGSHLPNGIKSEIVSVNIPPLEFADLNVHQTRQHSHGTMEESHYSDDDGDGSSTKQNLKIVKVEELDPIDGLNERFEDEEQKQDHGGDTESEYEDEANASDDTESEKGTKKRTKNLKHVNELTCTICDMKFARYSRLYYHVGQHHRHEVRRNENGPNENECESCGRCYTAPQYLEQHFRDKHAKYKCEKCGITVMLKLQLYQHFASDCGRKPINVCVVCKKSFDTSDQLKAHKATHTPSQLKCERCDKVYDTYNQLRVHSIQHTTLNEWFHCKHCPRKFRREAVLRSHMSKHTGVKPMQCQACGERFLTFKKLQAHRKSRPKTCKLVVYYPTNETVVDETADDRLEPKAVGVASRKVRINDLEFACTICEQKYAYKHFLDKHILLHGADGKLVHKCECCTKFFATKEEKDDHRKEVHAVEITCPHCEKVCRSRSSLRTHIRIKHLKQHPVPRYTCVKCGLSFVSREFHENHEKSNCGQNPIFTCKVCGKCLTNKYTYRNHLSLHRDDSETKTFICTYCGKGWRSKSQLQSHTRFHTNERPYKCDFCEKRFCDPTSKKTHESIHTGIKPYMCQCGDRFSCISNLQSHRRARKTTCGLLPLISKAFPQMIPETVKAAKE